MKFIRLSVLLLPFVLASCDLNPFNMGCKEIGSGYSLCQTDDQSAYLIMKSGGQPEGGGVLDGAIERIGWNARYIVAWRHATFRGDPDGWMKIDTNTRQIAGPISEGEVITLLGNKPPKDPRIAWKNL